MNSSKEAFFELAEKADLKAKEEFEKQYELVKSLSPLDGDGYPTSDALKLISIWHWSDCKGWFEFIKSIWHLKSWGWNEQLEPHEYRENEMVQTYYVSTAGWSGNEAIIKAMMKNDMLWSTTWVESRRGGHYIFEDDEL
jgi:hypothetical protein